MSIMRARLVMKMVTLVVTLVLTVMAARSCGSSSSSSPMNPATLTRNGLSGLCASQEAVNAASGNPTASAGFQIPAADAGLAKIAGLSSSSLSCSTTTTAPAGG